MNVRNTPEWLVEVAAQSGAADDDVVRQLLHAVRRQLGMQVAWLSQFLQGEQVFRYVDAEPGSAAPEVGSRAPLSGSFCARVLDGRLPGVIADAHGDPATALLDITRDLDIGCYVGVPLVGVDGRAEGMLCATSSTAMPVLGERDLETMRLLAGLLRDLQERAMDARALEVARQRLRLDLELVISGQGRWAVLQPIIEARSGCTVAFEGLSRFETGTSPAQWFDDASRAGLGAGLEVATADTVLAVLRAGALPAGTALHVNLSPTTVSTADLGWLLRDVDLTRVVVEVTEHQPVLDYAELLAALAPWRARGLRLAVDDAGAGYASLRHVLETSPDIIKLDMALVRCVDTDRVRQALLRATSAFAVETGSDVIAEGVETEGERQALVDLGIGYLQGFLFGHPEPRGV